MTIAETIRKDRESGAKRLETEYKAELLSFAKRFCCDEAEAEALVYRTFAEVVASIDGYTEQSAFFGWMCKILVNCHAKDVRRKSNSTIIFTDEVPELPDDGASRVFMTVDSGILRDAVCRLPKDMKDAVILHYFMDMPLKQIAQILSVPVGTVMSRLHYARIALTMRLGAKLKKPAVAVIAAGLLLLGATAAVVAGLHGTAGGCDGTDGTDGTMVLEASPAQGIPVVSDVSPVPDVPPSSSTKEKTTMKRITISRLFSGAVKCLTALSTTMLAASAANAADPYIESNGTAGMNMGYLMKSNSRLEVDFALTEVGEKTNNNRVFGADSVSSCMMYSLYLPSSSQRFAFCVGDGTSTSNYWSSVTPAANARHTAVFDICHDRIALLTGSVTNWSRATGLPSFPKDCIRALTLFGRPVSASAWAAERTLPARIYGVKIYEDDTLVHDYEPCEKDGIPGFRDRVGGGFKTNGKAWNAFAAGGDYTKYTSPFVATPENNSDTYIKTDYGVISNACVALDCAPISTWSANNCAIFDAVGNTQNDIAGNFKRIYAYFRNDTGFGVQVLVTSGGYITNIASPTTLTNATGAIKMRRTYGLDTVLNSKGMSKGFVVTAGETNATKDAHALLLTLPSNNKLVIAAEYDGGAKAPLRIYGCKISESGAAVREYAPAVVDGVAGLQDQMEGGGFVVAAVGTLTAGGFVPTVTASAAKISSRQTVTFTASAPGATSYRWYRNGEEISGETGATLTVTWRKGNAIDTYRAASVCINAGDTLVSGPSDAVALENLPKGTTIILR